VLGGLHHECALQPVGLSLVDRVFADHNGVMIGAGIYVITDQQHPHAHVEQVYNTEPVQMGRLVVTSTATQSTSGGLVQTVELSTEVNVTATL
jgi:hypothetical protein